MKTYISDIETNGFLRPKRGEKKVTEVFCLALLRLETGRYRVFVGEDIIDGLIMLERADMVIGHNWLDFDLPVLDYMYNVQLRRDHVRDTLCASRFAGHFFTTDNADDEQIEIPRNGHNLRDWGQRLGLYKGDIDHKRYAGRPGSDLSEAEWAEMLRYAEQDVRIGAAVYERLRWVWDAHPEPMAMERAVMALLPQQTAHGIRLDVEATRAHAAKLRERHSTLKAELKQLFPPLIKPLPPKTTTAKTHLKMPHGKVELAKGTFYYPVEIQECNPSSRQQMRDRFLAKKWEPTERTEKGNPRLNRAALDQMPFPEAAPLAEYYDVEKLLGMVETGPSSWLNMVSDDGRIYGSVASIGASTHRMAHFAPNLAQVSSGASERALFIASEGMIFVDVDATGLEARLQAHYLTRHDNGQYRDIVLNGEDLHSLNMVAMDSASRSAAKAELYAFTYGGGHFRLGHIDAVHAIKEGTTKVMPDEAARKAKGREIANALGETMPGLVRAIDETQDEFEQNGCIEGLDGRKIYPTSKHSAFNAKVQSAGAIVMKRALLIFDEWKCVNGHDDVYYCNNVHDEFLFECPPHKAEMVAQAAKEAIQRAGEYYGLLCPLAAEAKIGRTWGDVH